MKRIFALVLSLALILALAGCGASKVPAEQEGLTMQKLYDASLSSELLKTYESISVDMVYNGEVFGKYYETADYCYDASVTNGTYVSNQVCYSVEDGVYQRWLYLTPDGLLDMPSYRALEFGTPFFDVESIQDEIQSVTEEGEHITVKTIMSEKVLQSLASMSEGLISSNCEYVLDAKTYHPISADIQLGFENDVVVSFVAQAAYNTPMPEEIQPFLDYENQTEDLRTITVVFHTENGEEKTEQIQSPKGLAVLLYALEYYEGTCGFYADAACTEPFVSNGDLNADITIHLKWIA